MAAEAVEEKAAPRPPFDAGRGSCDISSVRVRVRLFASLRETAGRPELFLDLPDGATPEDAWRALAADVPALAARRSSLAASVNRRYAAFDAELAEGDEIVFIPPVSGG